MIDYVYSWIEEDVVIRLENSLGEIHDFEDNYLHLISFSHMAQSRKVSVSGQEDLALLKGIAEGVGGFFNSKQARENRAKALR